MRFEVQFFDSTEGAPRTPSSAPFSSIGSRDSSVYVGESTEEPLTYFSANVAGTISLLEAMRATGTERLVFSSSCATYGIPDALPIREDAPQRPINPYGRSKLMCEEVIRDVAETGALSAVILRYFNAAGADPDGEIGEDHDPETHIIPLILEAARAGGSR